MLENVLDNAIEAVERLIEDGVGYGYIRLKICNSDKVNGKNLLISVSNSCREESTDFSTTKTDKEMHGYGISNIENAVEKMGGICTMGIESREFRFVAKIPIIDNKKLQENGKKLQVEQNHQTLY
jgi:sensor histidine kinase regulating citrate/malate metabolism